MNNKVKIIITIIGILISAYLTLDLLIINLPYPFNFRRYSSANPLNRAMVAMLPMMMPMLLWWIPVVRWKKQKDSGSKMFKIIGLSAVLTVVILLMTLLVALLIKK